MKVFMMHGSGTRQRGVSLVEILVAMTIGIFLTGGLLHIFVSNKQTYRVQENLSRVQENGRFSMSVLGDNLRMAGYRSDPTLSRDQVFAAASYFASPNTVSFAKGQVIAGEETAGSPDALVVRYQGAASGATLDCLGNTVTANTIVANRFYIDNSILTCRSSVTDSAEPLTNNVEDMQLLYGMTTNKNRYHDVPADCYIDASTSGAGTDCTSINFSQVVSVRVALLLVTADDNLSPDGGHPSYQFNDSSHTATDKRLRRELVTTISLRNRIL